MSSNKQVSLTLTSRGHLRKIVREHYLRDDIKCGSMLCSTCRSDQLLSFCSRDRRMEDPKALIQPPNEIYPDWHYVVCDAETIVGQSDVFSHDAIVDMIVPISVLEEVRQKSLSVYRKFRVLLNNPRKRFFLFLNEFHRHTFVRKMLGESPDDRNFRALLAVVKFYKLHLLHNEYGVHLNLLIISDNEKHRMSAKAQGYAAFSMSEYVGGFGIAELSDRLRILSENESKIGEPSEFLYPAHLSIDKIKKLMLDGKVLQGKFFANSDNRQEGYVYLNEGDETLPEEAISRDKIFVQGHLNLNRAIHDDIVAVEILPESEWTSPQSIALDDEVLADDEAHLDEPVRSLNRVKSGKIVGIIRRTRKEFCGVLQDNASHEFVHSLFIPTEKRVPKIRIETRQADRLKSLMIVVSIDSWDRKSRYPSGHYCRSIGSRSDDNTWKSIIMMQHRIPDYPFSENVIESVKDAPNLLNEDEIASRCDLRDCRCIVSVDPQGCTDIDDALHCEQLENGNFECGVHIADVTHYVRPGSAVDAEAKYRCTSVYLTDRRIDMLPPILSSNVCSLRQDEDRLAFSVFWEIKPDAEIVNTKFLKTIIKNRAALEYEQAQLMMDDAKNESAVAKSLRNLNSIARILDE